MAKYTVPITEDTLIHVGKGKVYGIIVNSHTSGTLKLWDSNAANFSILMDTYTFASGSQVIELPSGDGEEKGVEFNTGLFADVGGTTANITILWSPRI